MWRNLEANRMKMLGSCTEGTETCEGDPAGKSVHSPIPLCLAVMNFEPSMEVSTWAI